MFEMAIDDLFYMIKSFKVSSSDAEIGYLENMKSVEEARIMDQDVETWLG